MEKLEAHTSSSLWPRVLLLACLVLTGVCGVLKLEFQKAKPPRFAQSGQIFDGYVSIDWYCHRAEQLRLRLLGETRFELDVLLELRDTLHPSAWLVPAAVALLALVTQSVPVAFAILSLLAMALAAWLVLRLVRACGGDRATAWLAGAAYASHISTIRASAQFYLDPFITVCVCLTLLLSLELARGASGRGRWIALYVVQALGLFVKSSYLPMLAVPALVRFLLGGERRVGAALRDGLVFGVAPLVPVLVFLAVVYGGLGSGAEDMRHLHSTWRLDAAQLQSFGREMLLLFQWLPIACLGMRVWRDGSSRALLAVLGLLLGSVWAFGLPAIGRLYLPAVAVLVAVSYAALARGAWRRQVFSITLVHAALNYAFAAYVLSSHAS